MLMKSNIGDTMNLARNSQNFLRKFLNFFVTLTWI
jgi:hypothetical protein